MIISQNKYLYGTFEIKCKIPKGCFAAFWLYGECCEEIDVFEFLSDDIKKFTVTVHECEAGNSNQAAGGKKHHQKGKNKNIGIDFSQDFHVWKLEWTPDYISVLVDGAEVRRCHRKGFNSCNPYGLGKSLFPDTPMNVIIGTGARKNSPTPSAIEVDYVKIWEWKSK